MTPWSGDEGSMYLPRYVDRQCAGGTKPKAEKRLTKKGSSTGLKNVG